MEAIARDAAIAGLSAVIEGVNELPDCFSADIPLLEKEGWMRH